MTAKIAQYGSWKSPITVEDVFAKFVWISEPQADGDNLYWCELRPEGRNVIVCRSAQGQTYDVTPAEFDVRTRVHEYGGGDYLAAGGMIYFSNFSDQKMYRQAPGKQPQPFTRIEGMRYADGILDDAHGRIIAVREDHTNPAIQAVNTLVGISTTKEGEEEILISGNDFYSTPRLSPKGDRLAWLTWNHPNMPWDGTELWVGELLPDGSIGKRTLVAGGQNESIFQPEWSPEGQLYLISDRTGWWNIYRWREQKLEIEAICPMEAEFGLPQWSFRRATYGFEKEGKLICSYIKDGLWHVASLNTRTLQMQTFDIPYTVIRYIHITAGKVYFIAGSATEPQALVQLNPNSSEIKILQRSGVVTVEAEYISVGQSIEFPTDNGLTAFGFFYPPKNKDFTGVQDSLPPLLVLSHGGPTGATIAVFSYEIQYWTTRGFAVLDVNYGGSTGYGRAYRERLNGKWGVVDVADCVNGARYLVDQKRVDGNQLAIEGGSAGGYVTLCAITFYKVFKAAASYFGLSDLEAFVKETHKFESRYLDSLVGPYPEQRELYRSRSPIHFIGQIACPLILIQGLDDPIVPPNQSEMIYEALRKRGVPVTYLPFPGEQHGFVKAENNRRALEAETYFYSKIFKFELADEIEPVKIENL